MSSTNNMALIEKLTGRENYPTWRFAVQTFLEHEDLWHCVTEKNVDVKQDLKAKSKIVLLVHPINYVHIQEAKTAKEVWTNLSKAFDDKGLTRRVGLLRDLITTTLETCQGIEDYVSKIMSTAHKLRNIGFNVNDEWLGTLLLAGLPEVYQPMIMALESSGVAITSDSVKTKLLQDVRSTETNALYVNKNKGKRSQFAKQASEKTSTGKGPRCFVCNKYGHISKNCRNKKSKEKSEQSTNYVAVFSATTRNEKGWYIDSGASMHMTMHSDWLYDKIPPPISTIKVANDEKLLVEACGKINLNVADSNGKINTIQVQNVLYVPGLATNLLSVTQMIKNGCHIQFNEKGCKILNRNKEQVATAKMMNNMYRLNTHSTPAYISASKDNDCYLWHQRMAHLNFEDLSKLTESVGIKLENKEKVLCISCQEGKQSRKPFPSQGSRAQAKLEVIHSDICGPMEVPSLGGAHYYVTFIDDFTRKVFVYILNKKSDVFEKFKEFKALVENQLDLKIKTLRTDNGNEYLSNEFRDFLKKSGISHQTTTPYTPQQNGLAERMNRTLLERARCMLLNAQLQKQYWAEAISTAAYITNRCPTRVIEFSTPEEKWSGRRPDITNLKVFGCEAMVHVPKEKSKKWDSKANKMIFIGYNEQTKGYRLLDPKTKKVLISRDVIFIESSVKRNYALLPLSESVSEPKTNDDSSTNNETKLENTSEDSELQSETSDEFFESDEGSIYEPDQTIDPTELTRNVTTRSKQRTCKMDAKTYSCVSEVSEQDDVPESYTAAISSNNVNAKHWKQSIQDELKAHEENNTWNLVEKPEGVRLIDCKWVFRIKDNPSGPIFKSRLCAKGCGQKQGIDYTEVYSPTVRYDSIRVVLSEAVQNELKIIQFDVKTAFLYGDVKEVIYMKPPEGLEVQSNLVCKLNRSLYGLKQAPRCWNQKFDHLLKKFGFTNSHSDKCVYIGNVNKNKIYLLLYVDDGLLISNSEDSLNKVLSDLKDNFEIKQCDPKNFVGLQIEIFEKCMFIHQSKYIERLLCRFNMQNANCNNVPVDPHTTLEKATEAPDKTIPYREAVGSLMHLAVVSRPDIMYGVSLVSRYLNCYDQTHWNVVKKILRYLKGTKDYGLCYTPSKSNLVGYSDADYAKDTSTRRSLTGYVFMKNGAAVTWATQRQQSVALSTTEAEFMAACSATKEAIWLKGLLMDINEFNQNSICLNIDNQSAICLIKNVDYHKRCKHIDIRYNFIKEKYSEKQIDLKYVNTKEQYADIFTKALPKEQFQYLRNKIGVKQASLK